MKKFKVYIKESTGAVNQVVWHGADKGSAIIMVPKQDFNKNRDLATLKLLKAKVPRARALTKFKADSNLIRQAGGANEGEYYLVHVDFTTRELNEAADEGPPSSTELAKDRHDKEKDDLKRRQDLDNEKARETDFRKKEADRKRETQKKDSAARSKKVNEYLEDGTDELVSTYKKYVPGQNK